MVEFRKVYERQCSIMLPNLNKQVESLQRNSNFTPAGIVQNFPRKLDINMNEVIENILDGSVWMLYNDSVVINTYIVYIAIDITQGLSFNGTKLKLTNQRPF